jgi:predicted nucleic acid-binding protein
MALAWIFERTSLDERQLADRLLEPSLAWQFQVPPVWHLEVANGLLVGLRRALLVEAEATTFLQHLYCLPITTDKTEPVIQGREAFLRGRSTGLTAYNADYLSLALRQGAALATFDRQLAAVARQAGVQLVE